jgi:IclR family transcriptional regulator, pca regulon regulatory protein
MPRLNETDSARREAVGNGAYFVEALARGLSVIHAFSRERSSMTLSDAARFTNLPKPTVRRVLLTLVDLGYAETDGRMFRLSPQVMSLAVAYLGTDLVSTVLQPACERIRAMVGESCFVGVLDGDDMMMIANANRQFPLGLVPSIGLRLPALSTAAGRILLGMLPDDELDDRLGKARQSGGTKFTVRSRKELRAIILQGRKDGFCMTRQEAVLEFHAVAVPLRRADGKPVGALSLAVRVERYAADPGILDASRKILLEEAEKLAGLLV